jgi:hypothetical protein
MTQITDYKSLLEAAKQEPQPQEFLFVFLKAFLPEKATPEQVKQFHDGQGGQLMPIMQVHKPLNELTDFNALVQDANKFSEEWQIVLIACLAGIDGERPAEEDINKHTNTMIDAVKNGQSLARYLAFNTNGDPIIW